MEIAVLGRAERVPLSLSLMLKKLLPDYKPVYIEKCSQFPDKTRAAFVVVDDMNGLYNLRSLAAQFPRLPITVVSSSPDYALEAIRQQSCDYLITPVACDEFERATERMGLYDKGGSGFDHFATG